MYPKRFEMIKISGLGKVYQSAGGDVTALENLDLEVDRGDIFGVIGLSGAGKSTLIRCINLLERPTSGSIEIDGKDVTHYQGAALRKLRSSLGMIFQHFNLLMQRTVRQNVAFPLEIGSLPRREIDARVNELLEVVGLSEKADAYPAQLSGGQKQRVAIARALANRPKVLLCDEATSALDPLTTKSILGLLKDINQKFGLTIVLITHEMAVVREICNRVAVIDSNHIVETGPVIDVIAHSQSESARKLFGRSNKTIPYSRLTGDSGDYCVRTDITLTGDAALKPIISTIARRFDVDVNILLGNVDFIQGAPLGELVVELSGSKAAVEGALHYIEDLHLKCEVLDQ
ncbi:MAG: Methionine import ATP-binding protein MetN [Syntrophorhabdaceae bacterium PtaU1.Bin034]|jgi:D-methionine transport system ATP-binding protein|nr:MAG: Methionine import ATP-binding protein MetN [Syntrophorhabdaceae bacterium PtaU1.Bin034]